MGNHSMSQAPIQTTNQIEGSEVNLKTTGARFHQQFHLVHGSARWPAALAVRLVEGAHA